jgi:hypothetical protein
MTKQEFDILVQQRVQKIQQTLIEKGKELQFQFDQLKKSFFKKLPPVADLF